jgi:predicted acyl esterase
MTTRRRLIGAAMVTALAGGMMTAIAAPPQPGVADYANHTGPSARWTRLPAGNVAVGQSVRFIGHGSKNADGTPVADHLWDFGDGTRSSAADPVHLFTRDGTYVVQHAVHDASGWRGINLDMVNVGHYAQKMVRQEIWIPTQGVRMHGWVTRPAGKSRVPVILTYGPYGAYGVADSDLDISLVRSGYAVASVSAPGRDLSTGHFDMFGGVTRQGGYDAVEWFGKQSWSTGKIALNGLSGPAVGALLTASARPPHLAAVVSKTSYADQYRDIIYPGGIPNSTSFVSAWIGLLLGQDALLMGGGSRTPELADRAADTAAMYAAEREHPDYDAYWLDRCIVCRQVSVPVLHYGNAHDLWPRAAFELYKWFRPAGGRLIFNPGGHASDDPSGFQPYASYGAGESRLWFDHYLKGIANGVDGRPGVEMLTTGGGDLAAFGYDRLKWVASNSWPLATSHPENLYLSGAPAMSDPGILTLSSQVPFREEPTPLLPVPTQGITGGTTAAVTPVAGLQRADEAQSVTFETGQLPRDVQVNGPMTLRLWARLATPDAAFVTHVNDVWTSGESNVISEGGLLASFRAVHPTRSLYLDRQLVQPFHPMDVHEQLVPGVAYPFDIEIWPVANVFRTGHRIRLTVALQNAVWRANATPGAAVLLHDRTHPSVLRLPVVPAGHSWDIFVSPHFHEPI